MYCHIESIKLKLSQTWLGEFQLIFGFLVLFNVRYFMFEVIEVLSVNDLDIGVDSIYLYLYGKYCHLQNENVKCRYFTAVIYLCNLLYNIGSWINLLLYLPVTLIPFSSGPVPGCSRWSDVDHVRIDEQQTPNNSDGKPLLFMLLLL